MTRNPIFFVFSLAVFTAIPTFAANILIVAGTDGAAQAVASNLNTELTTAGNTVTAVDTGLPGTLTGYTQIYDVRWTNAPAFSGPEQTEYVAFLNAAAGNTIFLMGENSYCCGARNSAMSAFVTAAGGGTVITPASTGFTETVQPPFNAPNAVTSIAYQACGIAGSAGSGAFATTETGGTSGCSIYWNRGTLANATGGALVVVYDINFILDPQSNSGENPFRENLEAFVSNGGAPAPSSSASAPVATPALNQWALLALGLLMGGTGYLVLRSRWPGRT